MKLVLLALLFVVVPGQTSFGLGRADVQESFSKFLNKVGSCGLSRVAVDGTQAGNFTRTFRSDNVRNGKVTFVDRGKQANVHIAFLKTSETGFNQYTGTQHWALGVGISKKNSISEDSLMALVDPNAGLKFNRFKGSYGPKSTPPNFSELEASAISVSSSQGIRTGFKGLRVAVIHDGIRYKVLCKLPD